MQIPNLAMKIFCYDTLCIHYIYNDDYDGVVMITMIGYDNENDNDDDDDVMMITMIGYDDNNDWI